MMKQFEAFPMMPPMMSKSNMDAVNKSMNEFTKGAQAIAAETSNYTKQLFEDGSIAAEKIMGAKSLDKAMEVQANYAKHTYELHMAQLNKFAELYANVAKDVFAPVEKAFAGK